VIRMATWLTSHCTFSWGNVTAAAYAINPAQLQRGCE
jgi:hypothetical protein